MPISWPGHSTPYHINRFLKGGYKAKKWGKKSAVPEGGGHFGKILVLVVAVVLLLLLVVVAVVLVVLPPPLLVPLACVDLCV